MAKLVRGATGIFAAVGVIWTLVSITPLVSVWGRAMAGTWDDPRGEVLIVLGGSTQDPGIMGPSSYLRSLYTVLIFRQGGVRHVVVSGGGPTGATVADSMKQFMVCHGIPASAISVEGAAQNTYENALFTKPIVAPLDGRKILLTSDYHMRRALAAFRKAGVDVLPRPIPDATKRGASFGSRADAFLDLVRETSAIAYYWVRGWI